MESISKSFFIVDKTIEMIFQLLEICATKLIQFWLELTPVTADSIKDLVWIFTTSYSLFKFTQFNLERELFESFTHLFQFLKLIIIQIKYEILKGH